MPSTRWQSGAARQAGWVEKFDLLADALVKMVRKLGGGGTQIMPF